MKIRLGILLAVLCAAGLYPYAGSATLPSFQEENANHPVQAERTVYAYRLRGEVRLLFLWVGKNDVGGGHIRTIRRAGQPPDGRFDEIEVLFGSDPSRVPKGINRWGYGHEVARWIQEDAGRAIRLVETEFRGIMRHSAESSLNEALDSTKKASEAGQFLYDATLSRVTPALSTNESRILAEKEGFNYRNPESLLEKFRDSLANTPPAKRGELANTTRVYDAPYGFLTGVAQLIRRVREGDSKASLTYVYNSKPYTLSVRSVRPLADSQLKSEWKDGGVRDVSKVRFQIYNTIKKARMDFELWLPRSGPLEGIPVRILHQPRWWLRLQLDLDIPKMGS